MVLRAVHGMTARGMLPSKEPKVWAMRSATALMTGICRGSYTAEFDYDVVGTLAVTRYNEEQKDGCMQPPIQNINGISI